MAGSVNAATAANRVNIPAVCRIPGRGTAILVAPGVLLTSKRAVGNTKHDTARQRAVFFECGKKGVVEVALLPHQLYFTSVYPEYLDYCLVACETTGIFGVTPVRLPLVRSEWQPVREGDTLLVVQHPLYNAAVAATTAGAEAPGGAPQETLTPLSPPSSSSPPGGDGSQPVELKRFEEVLRRRDDVYHLKAHGRNYAFGCPAFNDNAELVGLQSQFLDPVDGLVSRVVSIVTIVKHLFANAQLSKIPQNPLFDDVWSTWYVPNDTTRIVAIMANFKQRGITRKAAERLCEHTAQRELIDGVVACGATKVIIDTMRQLMSDDEENSSGGEFTAIGLRSLWNISFTEEDNRRHIVEADGVTTILNAMEKFPHSEDIAQYGVVVLFNLTLTSSVVSPDWASRGLRAVLNSIVHFDAVEVIQKFGIGFFVNLAKTLPACGRELIDLGGLQHIAAVANARQHNEYLAENIVAFVSLIAGNAMRHTTTSSSSAPAAASTASTNGALFSWSDAAHEAGKPLSDTYSATPSGGAVAVEFRQHPALKQMLGPLLQIAKRYPHNGSLQRSVNSALWSLGNDTGLRVALFEHPLGLEVLTQSTRSVSSARQL